LRYSIREYRPSELYCFQWIDFIIDQIKENQREKFSDKEGDQNQIKFLNDKEAGRLFTELVDNNEKILDYKINDKIINEIIGFVVKGECNKKFVKILRALCICNNKSVLKNQIAITNSILLNPKYAEFFLFRMEVEDETIFVYNTAFDIERVRLSYFKSSCQNRKEGGR
jgi:hypothetical protein